MPSIELRGGGVKARRPRASAVEAKRRALHAAEHSASIACVMANGRTDRSTRDQLARPAQDKTFPENFPHDLRAQQTGGRRALSGDGDSQTVTRTIGSHGVSDPVRAGAERSLTSAAGSLTPWSLL